MCRLRPEIFYTYASGPTEIQASRIDRSDARPDSTVRRRMTFIEWYSRAEAVCRLEDEGRAC